MIQSFVDRFMERKESLREMLSKEHPADYKELVKTVLEILYDKDDRENSPNIESLVKVSAGGHSGELLFTFSNCQAYDIKFYYLIIDYGSCGGCDTLEAIKNYSSEPPTKEQLDDYMTLALHIVQRIKELPRNEE